MSEPADTVPESVVIKKYSNRRLYSPGTKAYVTLEDLSRMVRDGTPFIVRDTKTGEDITASVLTNVVFDEDSRNGPPLMPIPFMREVIRYYGTSLQVLLPLYLDYSMRIFVQNQENLRQYMEDAFSGLDPSASFEAVSKRNMALLEQSIRTFPYFHPATATDPDRSQAMADIIERIEAIQAQLQDLAGSDDTHRSEE